MLRHNAANATELFRQAIFCLDSGNRSLLFRLVTRRARARLFATCTLSKEGRLVPHLSFPVRFQMPNSMGRKSDLAAISPTPLAIF